MALHKRTDNDQATCNYLVGELYFWVEDDYLPRPAEEGDKALPVIDAPWNSLGT